MKKLALAVSIFGIFAGVVAFVTRGIGFTSRRQSSSIETFAAHRARRWATPQAFVTRTNPVAASDEVLHEAMAHWADHCASCHSNDGSGSTALGRSLYPPVPDMRGASTQQLTDGELLYIIEQGVPFTGMPAWGTGTADGERQSWELVRFIRHLPKLSSDEIAHMETLNPKSAAQIEEERSIDDFLSGK